jgi:hypothetical protein
VEQNITSPEDKTMGQPDLNHAQVIVAATLVTAMAPTHGAGFANDAWIATQVPASRGVS